MKGFHFDMSIELLIAAANLLDQESTTSTQVSDDGDCAGTSSSPSSHDPPASCGPRRRLKTSATIVPRRRRRTASDTVDSDDLAGNCGGHRELRQSGFLREAHNRLEKNRRAHLRQCFELLRRQLPCLQRRRASDLSILRTALKCISALKKKDLACRREMERLYKHRQQKLGVILQDDLHTDERLASVGSVVLSDSEMLLDGRHSQLTSKTESTDCGSVLKTTVCPVSGSLVTSQILTDTTLTTSDVTVSDVKSVRRTVVKPARPSPRQIRVIAAPCFDHHYCSSGVTTVTHRSPAR